MFWEEEGDPKVKEYYEEITDAFVDQFDKFVTGDVIKITKTWPLDTYDEESQRFSRGISWAIYYFTYDHPEMFFGVPKQKNFSYSDINTDFAAGTKTVTYSFYGYVYGSWWPIEKDEQGRGNGQGRNVQEDYKRVMATA